MMVKMMAGYNNFQTNNAKYTRKENRHDSYSPDFVSFVQQNPKEMNSFTANLDKWVAFISWARWYP